MDKMDFREFKMWAIGKIRQYLPLKYQDAEIDLIPVIKTGTRYTGMTVKLPEQCLTPAVNLEDAYEHYLLDMPLDLVGQKMAEIVMSRSPELDMDLFSSYENVRDHLFLRVCGRKRNPELLQKVPHKRFRDLAFTYHVLMDAKTDGLASAMITLPMLEEFGVSLEQLHKDALKNSERILPVRVERIGDFLKNIGVTEWEREESSEGMQMTVITNSRGIDGASAYFYPGIAEQLSKELGGNYYILPSSIHELIAIPASANRDWHSLELMVRQINRFEVSPEDQLSDHVYRYNAREHSLELMQEHRNKERGERREGGCR
ncbi:MAG: hypothetical protein IKF05_04390 [Erysipelotrichaceae bacterium]|nr:hypothetical protein [Erysipelotrichaceae bacterium]